jgi:ssDNA-binding Zn-finger/Zn-ribbon topoisomerase 1
MSHAIDYFTTDKRDEIYAIAEEYASYTVDRQENPSGHYHGNMTIHDNIVCDSYEDAVAKIDELDDGFYDDHAVKYKDKDSLKPTKAMMAIEEKKAKLVQDRLEYEEKHSIKARKSEFVGCPKCKSRISVKHIRGERCPVCGEELRAQYVLDRIEKYHDDYKTLCDKYQDIVNKRKEKCPIRWCFKVEVHC